MKNLKDNFVSIGVFVYNEEKNIRAILEALLNQRLNKISLDKIIVVSSGSTDNTNNIIKEISKKHKKILLLEQAKREGKASAINLFLKKAKTEIIVIESGDTIPERDCIENLCSPFLKDSQIGLTGARAIPTNDKNTFLGTIIHYWWWMHDKLPRFGEMIAFRKSLCPTISPTTAVDEAYIESIISNKGYKKFQASNAVLHNHGAETLKDMIKQRKRIYIGHKLLRYEKKYAVKSFNHQRLIRLTIKYVRKENSIKTLFYIFCGALIEIYSRILGRRDLKNKKNPYVWEISKTTKKVK